MRLPGDVLMGQNKNFSFSNCKARRDFGGLFLYMNAG